MNAVDNPVDLGFKSGDFDASREMLQVILNDNGVDAVAMSYYHSPVATRGLVGALLDISGSSQKPITICIGSRTGMDEGQISELEGKGLPVYPTPERAVTGIAALVRYGEILKAID